MALPAAPTRKPKRRGRGLVVAVSVGLAAAVGGGCRDFEAHRGELESLYAAGRFDQAAAVLDDPKVQALYGDKSAVLWKLDRGAVARALADDQRAISLLNEAESQIEVQRKNAGDVLTQWLLSDAFARYFPEPYEDTYVNVLKLLAQLEAGRLQGGATVEARRAAGKADLLRDTWLKYDDAIKREGAGKIPPRAGSVVATNNAGEFIESPLATFLTAVTFMKNGEREMQRVAGKRLADSIQLQKSLIGPVREEDFAGLDELDPRSVNVLVVALSGRGPTKYAQQVGPIPIGTVPLYFELPYLHVFQSEVAAARVEVEGGSVPQALGQLKLVEDLGQVASINHERALPQIYARTLLRYALKAGASVAVTEGQRRRAHEHDQGLVQLAGVLGGLAFLGLTEKADVRAWVFLPGQARVGLLNLEPGEHRIRTVYESAVGGSVYASPWRTIHVTSDGLATVVTQYWR